VAPVLVCAGLFAACSDYALNNEKGHDSGGLPELVADPAEIDAFGICAEAARDVLLQNDGSAPLTLTGIGIEGNGWTISSAPSLPHTLGAGESTLVGLVGTDGSGALVVDSDDPANPRLRVPLSAAANEAPTARIDTPVPGQVIDEGDDLALLGYVSDTEDEPDTLAVSWTGSVDGLVSAGTAAGDGSTSVTWTADSRSAGAQSLTLAVTDSCGISATASVDFCQEGATSYDALSLTSWHYEGAAAYDSTEGWLQLTPATQDSVGTAFETSAPVNADDVSIEFYMYIGDGTGADGISLTALDTSRMTTFLGGTGCGIGYGGDASCTSGPALPGWSIEFDTYYNSDADPTSDDHVAFTFDGDVDGYEAWAALPEMEDTGWHFVEVTVVAPHVTVAVDGTTYLDQDIPGNYSFSAYVGFTAGTGGETNRHLIDDLTVTDYRCD
jgi:hypothetical protein